MEPKKESVSGNDDALPETFKAYLGVYLKGMAMGAADVVPGVSGGTVAFIAGIYGLLITSIQHCSRGSWPYLIRGQLFAFWRHINGTFLAVLGAGILTSVVVFARFVHTVLVTYPQLLWGFFLGLILASSYLLYRHLAQRSWREAMACVIGMGLSIGVCVLSPAQLEPQPWVVFGAGMVAICAMILPGISGSFLLLLMGLYQPIIAAVKQFEFGILVTFALGCVVGLVAFSRLVAYFLSRHASLTVALLTGFMLGALVKVWPWQYALTFRINHDGEQVATSYGLTLPQYYEAFTGASPMTLSVFILMFLGVSLVLGFDWWRSRERAQAM